MYNQLQLVHEADAKFERQLASTRLTRDRFFSKLAPIFLEEEHRGKYAACLIHRHYLLEKGERMVTTGNIAKPMAFISPNIIPERWLSTGEEVEHRYASDLSSLRPPSTEFLSKFKAIVDKHGVDVLGLGYAPDVGELAPGYVFLESVGAGDREQVTTIVPESSINFQSTIQTAWVAKKGLSTMQVSVNCDETACSVPPPPPPQSGT